MCAEGKTRKQIHAETELFGSSNSYLSFFTNPIYKGELHYADLIITDYCQPIVSAEMWDKVQKVIDQLSQNQKTISSARHPRRQSGVYILSGLSKCGLCHAPHYGHTSNQRNGSAYLRYACTRAKRRHDCNAKMIPADFLENTVLNEIKAFYKYPQNIINMLSTFSEATSSYQDNIDEEISSLTSQLATTRKSITNLTNAIAEAGHTQAILKKLASSEEQEKSIFSKLSELKTKKIPPVYVPTVEQATYISNEIIEKLKSKDRTFIHQILMGMIYEIETIRDGDNLHGVITLFHVENKKKVNTVSLSSPSVGAPIYRHSIKFESIAPKKKPVS